jgi:hypothetical protein
MIHAHKVLGGRARPAGHRAWRGDSCQVVVEAAYVEDLIDRRGFETICHEHLCCFSLTVLDRLFRGGGFVITDAARVPLRGGSL